MRGLLGALPAAYAVLAPVVFLPNSVDAYVLPRVALTLGCGALLFAAGWRGGRGGLGGLRWPLLAVGLAAVIACLLSVNPWLSLAGAYTRYESLPVRLAYLGLFAGAVWLGGRGVRPAFVLGASVVAVEAVYQVATGQLPRPDGNLGQPNLLGALLAMALPLALELGLGYRPWLLTLPLLALGLYESSSRSGWLGALVALLVFAAVRWVPGERRRVALLGAAALTALALLVLVASPLRNLNQDTGAARVGVWGDGVRMLAARPLTGWGEDATGLVFGRFQTQDWEPGDTFDRIHDQPLDLLVTEGVLSGAAGFWMWAVFWGGAWRRLEAPVAGLLAACAAYAAWSLLNFDWAPATGPFFLLAGVAWGELGQVPAGPPVGGPPAAQLPACARTLAVVAGLAAGLLVAVPPVLADVRHYAGDDAAAVRWDPLQAQYHRSLGERLGRNPAGLAELERARDLGEYDYSFFIELGDTAAALGRKDEARAAYERAESIYRFDPEAAQRLRSLDRL